MNFAQFSLFFVVVFGGSVLIHGHGSITCQSHTDCYDSVAPLAVYQAYLKGNAHFGLYGCQCVESKCQIDVTLNSEHTTASCASCGPECRAMGVYRYLQLRADNAADEQISTKLSEITQKPVHAKRDSESRQSILDNGAKMATDSKQKATNMKEEDWSSEEKVATKALDIANEGKKNGGARLNVRDETTATTTTTTTTTTATTTPSATTSAAEVTKKQTTSAPIASKSDEGDDGWDSDWDTSSDEDISTTTTETTTSTDMPTTKKSSTPVDSTATSTFATTPQPTTSAVATGDNQNDEDDGDDAIAKVWWSDRTTAAEATTEVAPVVVNLVGVDLDPHHNEDLETPFHPRKVKFGGGKVARFATRQQQQPKIINNLAAMLAFEQMKQPDNAQRFRDRFLDQKRTVAKRTDDAELQTVRQVMARMHERMIKLLRQK